MSRDCSDEKLKLVSLFFFFYLFSTKFSAVGGDVVLFSYTFTRTFNTFLSSTLILRTVLYPYPLHCPLPLSLALSSTPILSTVLYPYS